VFLGEFQHSLDAKGRIILPSKFRALLESGLVISRGLDNCLWVMAQGDWNAWFERLREQMRIGDPRQRGFARFIFSGASEDRPDKQGRVSVPENLRKFAGLEREISVIGAGTRIEIWNRERWERKSAEAAEGMEENLGDLPF
jgi:MraZ protein